jgi:hypothetical protein
VVERNEVERMMAFRSAFRMLERRIQLFLALRHKEMSRPEAAQKVTVIGRLTILLGPAQINTPPREP